jgi:hypothetical protein
MDPTSQVSLAFGHLDDRYYEDDLGLSDGYHATMSADGTLALYRHSTSAPAELLSQLKTPPIQAGQWVSLKLSVSSKSLVWTRTDLLDLEQVVVEDSSYRGGYLHIGKSSTDLGAALSLREFSVA